MHFVGNQLYQTISSHPDKRAYKVEDKNGKVEEEVIVPTYLGGSDLFIRRAVIGDAASIHAAHMRSIQ